MESFRKGVVIIVRFRLGSARLDIEDPYKSAFGKGKLRESGVPCCAKGKDAHGWRRKMFKNVVTIRFLSPLKLPTQCELLKKVYSIEKGIGGLVKIPMGEGVAAGDGVGDRVVGGAVGSAMESWLNAKR